MSVSLKAKRPGLPKVYDSAMSQTPEAVASKDSWGWARVEEKKGLIFTFPWVRSSTILIQGRITLMFLRCFGGVIRLRLNSIVWADARLGLSHTPLRTATMNRQKNSLLFFMF